MQQHLAHLFSTSLSLGFNASLANQKDPAGEIRILGFKQAL